MKKFTLILALFFGYTLIFSQNAKSQIEKDYMEYSRLILDNKMDKAFDYVNPKLFEVFPRETMVKLFETLFNSPEMEYKMALPKVVEIGEIKKIDGVDYAKLKTISPMEMKINSLDAKNSEQVSLYQGAFEQEFGKGNVSFNKESGFFKITAHKDVVASSTDNQKSWKFIAPDNEAMTSFLESILPKEMLQ